MAWHISNNPTSLCCKFADINGYVPEVGDEPGLNYEFEDDPDRMTILADGCAKLEEVAHDALGAIEDEDLWALREALQKMQDFVQDDPNVGEFLLAGYVDSPEEMIIGGFDDRLPFKFDDNPTAEDHFDTMGTSIVSIAFNDTHALVRDVNDEYQVLSNAEMKNCIAELDEQYELLHR